jgi:hypothetical protein
MVSFQITKSRTSSKSSSRVIKMSCDFIFDEFLRILDQETGLNINLKYPRVVGDLFRTFQFFRFDSA